MSLDQSKIKFYVGSYTDFSILAHKPNNAQTGKGIYEFEFKNGEIKPLSTIKCENPAVLSFHPNNKNIMYALTEGINKNGTIHSFKLNNDNDNKINKFGEWFANGKSTCYFSICPDNMYGIAINYWEGSIDLYQMHTKFGSIIRHVKHINHNDLTEHNKLNRRQVKNREDHWVNRQVGAHAHSVHYHEGFVYIPDLGENSIFVYKFNPNAINDNDILRYIKQIKLQDGCGPRHLVINKKNNIAYISNELNSSIAVLKLNSNKKQLITNIDGKNNGNNYKSDTIIQYIDTYDKTSMKYNGIKNYVAEIAMSKDSKYVYVSNRGVDTIGIYKILNDGKLKYIDNCSVYGKVPRHFTITPDNKYIISANQDSNTIIVLKRDINTGLLQFSKKYDAKKFNEMLPGFEFNAPNFVLCEPTTN